MNAVIKVLWALTFALSGATVAALAFCVAYGIDAKSGFAFELGRNCLWGAILSAVALTLLIRARNTLNRLDP